MPATPAWPPKSAPRLFVSSPLAEGAPVTIEGPQAHYLSRVMRVASGDVVILCDNITGEWAARVASAGKRDVSLVVEALLRPREAVPDFTLCAALLKKDRFDLVLEKACELGVARIQPVITRRCVADKLNLERARAILTEAAEQCARTALPDLAEPVKLDALLKGWDANNVMGRTLFFADEAGGEPAAAAFQHWQHCNITPLPSGEGLGVGVGERGPKGLASTVAGTRGLTATLPHPKPTPPGRGESGAAALLTGPEGGFDETERAAIRALPQTRAITLGPRILRGETAAIAGCALWMGIVGDW